jgi:hypothetical protein
LARWAGCGRGDGQHDARGQDGRDGTRREVRGRRGRWGRRSRANEGSGGSGLAHTAGATPIAAARTAAGPLGAAGIRRVRGAAD